jgi:hypothetical protein
MDNKRSARTRKVSHQNMTEGVMFTRFTSVQEAATAAAERKAEQ